jgi:ABC-type amino acid transport substrate-binding protein
MTKGLAWLGVVLALIALALGLGPQFRKSPGDVTQTRRGTLSKILEEKELRVGYIDYYPSAFRDPQTSQLRGNFVDALNEIIRQLDPSVKVTYEETTWTDFSTMLSTGRVDLSIAGTFTTIPRAKLVAFTRPLVFLGRSAIVRKDDTRFSAEKGPLQFDRPDIRVAVVDGEGSYEYVRANFKNQDNLIVFSGSDLSQCLAAVSSGQADVGMSDALETMKYAQAHPQVVDLFGSQPYDPTPIAWAVRQDDVIWKTFLDTAIEMLEAQGKLSAFEHRYDYRWLQPVREFRKR